MKTRRHTLILPLSLLGLLGTYLIWSVPNILGEELDKPEIQFRFYANQIKANFEKIETLSGTIAGRFRTPANSAKFHYDKSQLGDGQIGLGVTNIPGDFVRESTEIFDVVWERGSGQLVSIGKPIRNPTKFFEVGTEKEILPKFKESEQSSELQSVINDSYKIFSSLGSTTNDLKKVFTRTQNVSHKLRGSPKSLFYLTETNTYHDFMFGVATQLENEPMGKGNLEIEGNTHTLELVVPNKSKDGNISYRFSFDSRRNFVLTNYETIIDSLPQTKRNIWQYEEVEPNFFLPVQLDMETLKDGDVISNDTYTLTEWKVNERLPADTFTLASLSPKDGSVLVDKETGENFVIRDEGKTLVPEFTSSKRPRRLWLPLTIGAILVALLIIRSRLKD